MFQQTVSQFHISKSSFTVTSHFTHKTSQNADKRIDVSHSKFWE